MSNHYNDAFSTNRSEQVLSKIADALGYPNTTFSQKNYNKPEQTSELFRLWSMVEHEQDCLKILAFVRTLAGRAGAE